MKQPDSIILMMADDDPDDREFVREAFEECGFRGDFRFVEDGADLIASLTASRSKEANLLPDMILLDLNMPRVGGYEALEFIKSDALLRKIPVVVLTTSESEDDIERTYEMGGNSFITKPAGFEGLVSMAENLTRYWLETVRLPGQN